MDHQPAGLKFGAIGHQDHWDKVVHFVNTIRDLKAAANLSLQQIKEVYGFIPPRPLFDVVMQSATTGPCEGVYIETFIAPDELDAAHLRSNLKKVKEACQYAATSKMPIVALGGFTSIILEATGTALTQIGSTYFTTGNTLTAGFIAKGVEAACTYWQQPLHQSRLMVIGATGDIGSACTRYFAGSVKELLLCARQPGPLKQLAAALQAEGVAATASTDVNTLLPRADVVICVASSLLQQVDLSLLPPHAVICDAGYPKNLQQAFADSSRRLFIGGMGQVTKGFRFDPDYTHHLYRFPAADTVHGCLLEAIVLAMEGAPTAYSCGRGHITKQKIVEITALAASHGVLPAPLFYTDLITIPDRKKALYECSKQWTGTTV